MCDRFFEYFQIEVTISIRASNKIYKVQASHCN
jgi:hypothetical protein